MFKVDHRTPEQIEEDNRSMVADYIREKARRLGVPVIEPIDPPTVDQKPDHNPVVGICGKCGLELRMVMGYYCPHNHCPTGLGGTHCGTAGQDGDNIVRTDAGTGGVD